MLADDNSTKEYWREVRTKQLNKWRAVLVNSADECSFYREIPSQFVALDSLSPQEQERLIYSELCIFLLGYQSENIRLSSYQQSFPTNIDVNVSLDPFARSEIERFKNVLISLATIKIACYRILNDGVTFSEMSRAVATQIDDKVQGFVKTILVKLNENEDSTMLLNNLFREVHAITETLIFFSDLAKTIYKERLVGGQLLSLLHNSRSQIYAGTSHQNMEELFDVAWRVFARYIGRAVTSFQADTCNYEFVLWSKSSMEPGEKSRLGIESDMRTRSNRFVVITALCPNFFVKQLKVLLRCAEFGDMLALSANEGSRKQKGDDVADQRDSQNSQKALLEASRQVDWESLDVAAMIRMLSQFERKQSVCLLKQLRMSKDVDSAIRDTHQLVLLGSCINDLLLTSIHQDLLDKPIDEISSHCMKKLSNQVLGGFAEDHYPFWRHFRIVLEENDVFQSICDTYVAIKGSDSMEYGRPNVVPCFFSALSLSFDCPEELTPVISMPSIQNAISIFRLLFQIAAATHKVSLGLEELRGHMPTRGGDNDGTSARRSLLFSLNAALTQLKRHFRSYTDYAIQLFNNRIEKAASLDDYVAHQESLTFDVLRMVGLSEWSRLAYIKDLLNIVWRYDIGDAMLGELAAEFEELISTVRIEAPN